MLHVLLHLTPSTGATAVSRAAYGQGAATTLILLDNVGCIGSETRLIGCSNTGLGNHNCAHSEDAGVVCQSGTQCTFQRLQVYEFKHTNSIMN